MLINNKDIKTFSATLVSYEVGMTELPKTIEWDGGSYSPFISFEPSRFKEVTVKLLIEGSTREVIEKNKSNIVSELKKSVVKFKDAPFIYDGVLEDIAYENINRFAVIAEIQLTCLQQELRKSIILTKNPTQQVTIIGNNPCEVCYEITLPVDTASFTINDIKVNNLKKGEVLLIDGVTKRILVNNQNKFKDSEFWEFPKLNSGTNTINMSPATVDAKIHYNPCWI